MRLECSLRRAKNIGLVISLSRLMVRTVPLSSLLIDGSETVLKLGMVLLLMNQLMTPKKLLES